MRLSLVARPIHTRRTSPKSILSYLKDGWNLTAAFYEEFNTANRVTNYTTGDIFHVDMTATKTIGKWTFGPVAYYVAQVTDDKCPASCVATGESLLASLPEIFLLGSWRSRRV